MSHSIVTMERLLATRVVLDSLLIWRSWLIWLDSNWLLFESYSNSDDSGFHYSSRLSSVDSLSDFLAWEKWIISAHGVMSQWHAAGPAWRWPNMFGGNRKQATVDDRHPQTDGKRIPDVLMAEHRGVTAQFGSRHRDKAVTRSVSCIGNTWKQWLDPDSDSGEFLGADWTASRHFYIFMCRKTVPTPTRRGLLRRRQACCRTGTWTGLGGCSQCAEKYVC